MFTVWTPHSNFVESFESNVENNFEHFDTINSKSNIVNAILLDFLALCIVVGQQIQRTPYGEIEFYNLSGAKKRKWWLDSRCVSNQKTMFLLWFAAACTRQPTPAVTAMLPERGTLKQSIWNFSFDSDISQKSRRRFVFSREMASLIEELTSAIRGCFLVSVRRLNREYRPWGSTERGCSQIG